MRTQPVLFVPISDCLLYVLPASHQTRLNIVDIQRLRHEKIDHYRSSRSLVLGRERFTNSGEGRAHPVIVVVSQ